MCGFNGFISKGDLRINKELESRLGLTIARRGPDSLSCLNYEENECRFWFQHARLSIIDLELRSNQPYEKKGLTLVYNGEIYNYKEIRNELKSKGIQFDTESDTEVLLEAYLFWGESCLEKFVGMFAFAIHNVKTQELLLARDRVGVKPVYYAISDSGISFSSDLIAISKMPGVKAKMNLDEIQGYFLRGYFRQGSTALEGVYSLLPGSIVKIDLNTFKCRTEAYWSPQSYFPQEKLSNEAEVLHELESVLVKAFGYRMVSDVPVGVFLSGGIDSSVVAGILKKKIKVDFQTFTIGFEDSKYDESQFAERISQHLGVKNNKLIATPSEIRNVFEDYLEAFDEPFCDSSALPTMLVSRLASRHAKVVLSSDGGDELFGGYENYSKGNEYWKLLHGTSRSKVIRFLIQCLVPEFNSPKLTQLMKAKRFSEAKSQLDMHALLETDFSAFRILKNTNYTNGSSGFGLGDLNDRLVYDLSYYLPGDILKKVDRSTMYYSIEGREPLLDHNIFEFMSKVDESLKIFNGNKKYLLKKIAYSYIPEDLLNRPKKGFSLPLDKILRNDFLMYERFMDTLSEENYEQELFDSNQIKIMMNDFHNYRYTNFRALWKLFGYVNWKKNRLQ